MRPSGRDLRAGPECPAGPSASRTPSSGPAGFFIRRPIGTSLLAAGLLLAGAFAFSALPIATLPQVEYPTIEVEVKLPGADPLTVASTLAAPLERRFAQMAGVTEINSMNLQSQTYITLQFDLSRSVDEAAHDVQAAIDAAKGELPADLPSPPFLLKANPSDATIMLLALTSDTAPDSEVYKYGIDVVAQAIRQVPGVGRLRISGLARPAVRVQLDPGYLASLGLSLEDIRAYLAKASVNLPKGSLDGPDFCYQLHLDDQLTSAADYRPGIAVQGKGGFVRLGDLGTVVDGMENDREGSWYNGRTMTQIFVFKETGANVIDTVRRIRALLPRIAHWIPPSIKVAVLTDRTATIRVSVDHIEATLALSIALVVAVVFLFLRQATATLIPCLTVPLALAGAFAVMFLGHYTLDNLSLMALAVAIGFIVDDSIVVVENISRRLEAGSDAAGAAESGASQLATTVVSMSLALTAVFVPLLFMTGYIGRLLHEFAVTLAAAVLTSAVVSLTVTPTLCSRILRRPPGAHRARSLAGQLERAFTGLQAAYDRSLRWVFRHEGIVLGSTVAMTGGAVALYVFIPKGLFPAEDTGQFRCIIAARQDASFQDMAEKQAEVAEIIQSDPAVAGVASSLENTGDLAYMFVSLKPIEVRRSPIQAVLRRLSEKLQSVEAVTVFMQPVQELSMGALYSKSAYQYTLRGANWDELSRAAANLVARLSARPHFHDVATDLELAGLSANLTVDRTAASRLGVSMSTIDNTLCDAFGQRQVAVIYGAFSQSHVILESTPKSQRDPAYLDRVYLRSAGGKMVPLSAVTHVAYGNAPMVVNHQGQFPAVTISYNLDPGYSLSDARQAIDDAVSEAHLPGSVHGDFQGNAKAFEGAIGTEVLLVFGALVCVYLILGMLYESLIHPLTILSTLPSAGVGALLALIATGHNLDVVGVVGIVLLIGIVTKNAIIMVDFALEAKRAGNRDSEDCIYQACTIRFRPILMTTTAALFGALPLALVGGVGAELHKPLGISVVGGLVVSQALTLFTTPVVYLALDRRATRGQAAA